jgi:hypothetical protein
MLPFTNRDVIRDSAVLYCDAKVERQLVGLPWAADSCPWVGKLRTVLPFTNRDVIRDSAVQWGLIIQGGIYKGCGRVG